MSEPIVSEIRKVVNHATQMIASPVEMQVARTGGERPGTAAPMANKEYADMHTCEKNAAVIRYRAGQLIPSVVMLEPKS